MKTVQTLSLIAFASAALAQTPPAQTGIEKATFGMAKTTLEFLATDKKTFPKATETVCKDCQEYGDLSAFIQKNSLKKADGLVNDIKKHSLKLNDEFAADAFTSEGAMLDSLQNYVVTRITSGAERSHRKQLASFAAYQTKMTALAGGADPDAAVNELATNQPDGDETAAANEETPASASGSSLGTWAFWLALLNLLGLGYLWFMRQQGGAPKVIQSDRDDARIAGLQDENTRLATTVAELANRLTVAEKKLTTVATTAQPPQNRPAQPTSAAGPMGQGMGNVPANQPRANPAPGSHPNSSAMPMSGSSQLGGQGQTAVPPPSNVRPTPPIPPAPSEQRPDVARPDVARPDVARPDMARSNVPVAEPVPAPQPPATKFFARTADLGNGFSVSGLLKEPERGVVYDLELTGPTTATFRVSQTPEAQQLAMSDPYSYLSDACIYENQPGGPNSRIQTVTPGQLVLQGDKWQITDKARIGFM